MSVSEGLQFVERINFYLIPNVCVFVMFEFEYYRVKVTFICVSDVKFDKVNCELPVRNQSGQLCGVPLCTVPPQNLCPCQHG